MTRLSIIIATVLTCLASVRCTNSKFVKTVPTITNSLVNLGKMEIAFYFNGKQQEDPTKPTNPYLPTIPTRSHTEVPCPCTSFKSSKDPSILSDPSELIEKILKSNDLFKDPTSAHCCDSHEQVQEKTVYFELSAPRAPMTINNLKNPLNSRPSFRKLYNSGLLPRPKAMEIFLFPKRKDIANMDYSKFTTRPVTMDIKMVGDKEITPLNEVKEGSVKKDLTNLIEKKANENQSVDNLTEAPVTSVNNALSFDDE